MFTIRDRADHTVMTEADLLIDESGPKPFYCKDEAEAQDVAAEYEYECIAQSRLPTDVYILNTQTGEVIEVI